MQRHAGIRVGAKKSNKKEKNSVANPALQVPVSRAPDVELTAPQVSVDDRRDATLSASSSYSVSSREKDEKPETMSREGASKLGEVTKGRVFISCFGTSAVLLALSAAGWPIAQSVGPSLHGYSQEFMTNLVEVPQPVPPEHYAIAIAIALGVTAARISTMKAWPDYAEATERSLTQVTGTRVT